MYRNLVMLLVGCVALTGALSSHGDEAPMPSALLDKAIKAIGGEAKLNKYPGLILKGKGAYHEAGSPDLPFAGAWYTQGTDKGRTLIEIAAKNAKSRTLTVVNGDKGWNKEGDLATQPMTKEELADEKDNLYFNWVTMLAPLKAKDFTLTALPEAKVDGKATVGFTVAHKGRRDIKLYFDKNTSLLVKSERKVRDASAKKDVTEEVIFSNYKDVNGIKIAMKFSVKWDGQPQADAEMAEATVQEKLDDKLFKEP